MEVKFPIRFLGQHDEIDEILDAIKQGTVFRRRKINDLFEVDNLVHKGNELLLGEILGKLFGEVFKFHCSAFCVILCNGECARNPHR